MISLHVCTFGEVYLKASCSSPLLTPRRRYQCFSYGAWGIKKRTWISCLPKFISHVRVYVHSFIICCVDVGKWKATLAPFVLTLLDCVSRMCRDKWPKSIVKVHQKSERFPTFFSWSMASKGTQRKHPTGRSVVLEEAGNNLLISTHIFFSFFEEDGEKVSTFDLKRMCKMSQ